MLVDSGSTHSFLDTAVAKRVGFPTQFIKSQNVLVANGKKLQSNSMCRNFEWRTQGTEFKTDVLIMPITGFELILGMEWLNSLGVVTWDFPNSKMEFSWEGRKVTLQADKVTSRCLKEGKLGSWRNDMGLFVL